MGSHFGAIGIRISSNEDMNAQLLRLVEEGHVLGYAKEGGVRVVAHDDPSGSRVTVTMTGDRVTCVTPTFGPGAALQVRLGELAGSDCEYERPMLMTVLDGGHEAYPLAVQIDDLALSADRFVPRLRTTVIVSALAEMIDFFDSEEAFHAEKPGLSSESLIPSGTFAIPGSPDEASFAPTPRMLMSGIVESADRRRHSLIGGEFLRISVRSYGGRYEVLVDQVDVSSKGPDWLPGVGSIISGQFWLSGRS